MSSWLVMLICLTVVAPAAHAERLPAAGSRAPGASVMSTTCGDPGYYSGYQQLTQNLGGGTAIPDADDGGVTVGPLTIDPGSIGDVAIVVSVTHPSISQLRITATYDADCNGTPEASAIVLQQPACGSDLGCTQQYVFSESAVAVMGDPLTCGPPTLPGQCYRAPALSAFRNLNGGGCFRLNVADRVAGGTGTICEWSVYYLPRSGPAPGPCLTNVVNGGAQPGVELTWTDVAADLGYIVYRDGEFLTQVGMNVTTYVDRGYPVPDRTYCIEAQLPSGPSTTCCTQVSNTTPAVKVEPWDWFNDTFPFSNDASLPGFAKFDTCAALIKTGRNIAQFTWSQSRYDVPGDSVIVRAPNADRVDLVFRIVPGVGNYVTVGNRSTGLRRLAAEPAPVAITSVDGSFWSRYINNNGLHGTPSGTGVPHNPSVSPYHRRWDPHTWNSEECLALGDGVFVTQRASAPGEKILPDGLLTPGAHAEYFFRVHLQNGNVVLYPDTTRVLHTLDGDVDGHRWQQFGVLPDRWKALEYGGPGMAPILFVDLADRFGSERVWAGVTDSIGATASSKFGAHSGWHAVGGGADIDAPANNRLADNVTPGFIAAHLGQPGTEWDLYGVKGIESPWIGAAGSLGSRLGFNNPANTQINGKRSRQGPSPDMLNAYYKIIVLMSGEQHQDLLGPDVNRSQNDVSILQDWLYSGDTNSPNRGIYAAGEGFAQGLYETSEGQDFLINTLGVDLTGTDYRFVSGFGGAIEVNTSSPHTPASYDLDNATPNDVLEPAFGAVVSTLAAQYTDNGGGPYGASVHKPHSPVAPWIALTDGWDPAKLSGATNQQRLHYFCETLGSVFGTIAPLASCIVPASISGVLFYDFDLDGVRDQIEPGTANWTVELRSGTTVVRSTVTNGQGEYSFTDVIPGDYVVGEKTEAYWVMTAPSNGTHAITVGPMAQVQNVDFGNWQWIPTGPQCVRPPSKLSAWYPLDETGSGPSKEVMSSLHGVWHGTPTPAAGKIGGGLALGSGDYVSAASGTALNFGTGSFSIAAWIKTTGSGTQLILEKRDFPSGMRGYLLFLQSGKLAVQFGDGGVFGGNFIANDPVLTDDEWHHVAAVVDRGGSPSVKLYVDGVSRTVSAASVTLGNVSNNVPLEISGSLDGTIDEVELFSKALTLAEVQALYNAGTLGKCKTFCAVPKQLDFCQEEGVTTYLRIENRSAQTHDYIWSLAYLSVQLSGCSNPGPTVFTPPTGRVTLNAGQSVDLPIQVRAPSCPIEGRSFCYQATVVNLDDHIGAISTGALLHSAKLCPPCVQLVGLDPGPVPGAGRSAPAAGALGSRPATEAIPDGAIVIPFGGSRLIPFTISNRAATAQTITYAFSSTTTDPGPDATLVSLEGLAPGVETAPRSATIPARSSIDVSVSAEFLDYDPGAVPDVVLRVDVDDDSNLDEFDSRQVRTADGPGLPLPVDDPGATAGVVEFSASPNPFQSGVNLEFSLPAAQHVDARVFDTAGRLVEKLWSGGLHAGRHALRWDGRNVSGARSPAGVYLVRVHSAGWTKHAKLLLMR